MDAIDPLPSIFGDEAALTQVAATAVAELGDELRKEAGQESAQKVKDVSAKEDAAEDAATINKARAKILLYLVGKLVAFGVSTVPTDWEPGLMAKALKNNEAEYLLVDDSIDGGPGTATPRISDALTANNLATVPISDIRDAYEEVNKAQ